MPEPLAPVVRTHLDALSDGIGIMQHAIGSRPDPAHGYCTDDVARALQVDVLHQRELGWPAVADRAGRNLRFLTEAFDRGAGQFRNFRSVDGSWAAGTASEDSQGRAMHALGEVIGSVSDGPFRDPAAALFTRALPAVADLRALRAISSVALGCDAALRAGIDDAAATFETLTDRLAAAFARPRDGSWPWPEPRLTYENGLPVQAMIVAGLRREDPRMLETGLRVLDWLVAAQTAPDGHLSLVGNHWWAPGGPRSRFDQQPIDATALLLAAEAAFVATGEPRYRRVVTAAYGWFLGRNDLGIPVAEPERGACFDGLTARGVNGNQGAESTLVWLMALEHVRASGRTSRPRRVAFAAVRPVVAVL